MKNHILFLSSIFIILIGCDQNELVYNNIYSVNLLFRNLNLYDDEDFSNQILKTNCKIYQKRYNLKNEIIYSHSFEKTEHLSNNTFLEIRYSKHFLDSIVRDSPVNYLIGIGKFEKFHTQDMGKKCFVVCWINKPINSITKYKPGYLFEFTNGIDFTTNKLYSTLSKRQILKLFPNFNGIYHKINLSKVEINYNYFVSDIEFYRHIKLDSFNLGFDLPINNLK